jgi:hypothetical protein
MQALLSEKSNEVIVTRIDPDTCENTEITSLESKLKGFVFACPGVGRSLTGSLLGAYNPHVKTVYIYRCRTSNWTAFSSALAAHTTLTTSSPSVETSRLAVALGSLQLDLRRFRRFESNWDGEGADPFSSETLISAQEILGQTYEVAIRSPRQEVIPMLSPCGDGRICFTWKSKHKELWAYADGKFADLYRWHPLSNRESESFEHLPISRVREHIDWVLS